MWTHLQSATWLDPCDSLSTHASQQCQAWCMSFLSSHHPSYRTSRKTYFLVRVFGVTLAAGFDASPEEAGPCNAPSSSICRCTMAMAISILCNSSASNLANSSYLLLVFKLAYLDSFSRIPNIMGVGGSKTISS